MHCKPIKVVRKLQKRKFRKTMYELDKVLNKDKVNKKLSTELKEYRSNVKFMRTMLGLKKGKIMKQLIVDYIPFEITPQQIMSLCQQMTENLLLKVITKI